MSNATLSGAARGSQSGESLVGVLVYADTVGILIGVATVMSTR